LAKVVLTDRFISSDKRMPSAGREDYHDAIVPGLALRVSSTGHRSFVLVARYPAKPKNPTRRALGDYGELTLDQARDKARKWLAMVKNGKDPAVEAARERAEEARKRVNTFGAVADAFLTRHASKLRTEAGVRRLVSEEFIKRWRDRPVDDIQPDEVAAVIRPIVKRGAMYQAHAAFAAIRRLFKWALVNGEFNLHDSPVERLSPKDLIGARQVRERVLTDQELAAVWHAAEKIGYPYGPLFRMLVLTGQREREVADAPWQEFDLDNGIWTIPASRMKGKRVHEVPIAAALGELLKGLPRFSVGDYVFSTTAGTKHVNGFSKAKTRMDKASGVTDWRIHDLRRTVRTHFSQLPVPDMVRELVIAHARPELHRVYDQHSYREEKLECLILWEKRLFEVVAGALPSTATHSPTLLVPPPTKPTALQ
jgi:integrase